MTRQSSSAGGHRLWLWLLLLLAAAALGVGVWAWRTYDPFATSRPAVVEAKGLVDVARTRPLTADEFARAAALVEAPEPLAQLSAIAVLQLEGDRDPTRREAALAALERCRQSGDANVSRSAATAAARLRAK